MLDGTIAAVATAPGRAGISVIRISGDGAYQVADKVFKPRSGSAGLGDSKGYTAKYGDFVYQGKLLDEGVALCFRAPHSYTGEDVVELSCHGGVSVTESLLQSCYFAGARPAGAGEFTRRAVMNGRISLTQAEAVMDMIKAESKAAAALAKSAMEGALFRKIQKMKENLVVLVGHLAAWVDYPEEDVEPVDRQDFMDTIVAAENELNILINRYDKGNIIKRGVRVAIVGSPNVGKSTLFNILTGEDSAIVTSVAGTTRDVIRQKIEVGGVILRLSDTAGLHETEDIVEREGIRRSKAEIEEAGLVVAVFDGSIPLSEEQRKLAESCKGRPALGILNKSDIGRAFGTEELEKFFTKVVTVSSQDENTYSVIVDGILGILDVAQIDTDSEMLANQRQMEAAVAARDALTQARQAMEMGMTYDAAGVCVDDALRWLASLTGEDVSEAIIEEIFRKFCVGK